MKRAGLVFAVAVGLYLPTMRHGFVQDDWAIVARNPAAHSLGAALRAADDPYWPRPSEAGLWRPLALKYRGDLFCGLWSLEWNCGAEMSSELVQRVAARGLRLSFDIYFVDRDGEPSR